eukprot:15364497-Ditylum_brightwellii.AAC.5
MSQEVERDEKRNTAASAEQKRQIKVRRKQKQSKKESNKSGSGLDDHQEVHLIHYALTQYSLHKALSKFGEKREEAVMGKFSQLHERQTFKPLKCDKLTR